MNLNKHLLTLLFMLISLSCFSQTTAYNKPTSVDVKSVIMKRMKSEMPSENLYDTWDNTYCHSKVATIPNIYKIDLREFSMPIQHSMITSNFGPRWGRNHNGIDVKAYIGDTVRSAFSGKVRIYKYDKNGYGYVVVIRHWNGLETLYGHLSKPIAKVNDAVEAGQPIGLAGNTGKSTGTHLHFETRFCGVAINPLELFSFQYRDVTSDFYVWKK